MSNVSVCVRFRPLNARELKHGAEASCVRRLDDQSFVFKEDKEGEFTFCFDRIYYQDSTQAEVFEFLALPIIKDAMNAINGTILTYGQTGAGKTHSMEGPSILTSDQQQKGILPRVIECIFKSIEAADTTSEFIIKLSMVEIYMERIRDLFDPSKDNLQVKEDKVHGIFVSGANLCPKCTRNTQAYSCEMSKMSTNYPESCIKTDNKNGLLGKLKENLSKRTPVLEEIINLLRDLLVEEGIILDSCNTELRKNILVSSEAEINKTILILQKSLEQLSENNETLARENESMKVELRAARYLAVDPLRFTENPPSCSSGSAAFTICEKARIVRPLRGGSQHTQGVDSAKIHRENASNDASLSFLQITLANIKSFYF